MVSLTCSPIHPPVFFGMPADFFLGRCFLTTALVKNYFSDKMVKLSSKFFPIFESRFMQDASVFTSETISPEKNISKNHPVILRWAWVLPLLAAFFFTVSNACMRQLAGLGADKFLALALRESVAFYFAAPIFFWLLFSGRTKCPTKKDFFIFLGIALAVQLVGNVLLQEAFGVIGMAVGMAGVWTGLLIGAPIMGYLMLGERPSRQLFFSIFIIFAAMFCLTLGTKELEVRGETAGNWNIAVRVMLLLTVLSGLIVAVVTAWNRVMGCRGYSPFFVVTMLPGTGFIFLSLVDFCRNGVSTYAAFSGAEYFWAYCSGFANLLAFTLLTLGLRYLSVVKVSILNIAQLALAPLVGFLIFSENMNSGILAGILLIMTGIVVANFGGGATKNR